MQSRGLPRFAHRPIIGAVAGLVCWAPATQLAATPMSNPHLQIESARADAPAPIDAPLPLELLRALDAPGFASRQSATALEAPPSQRPSAPATAAVQPEPISPHSLKTVLTSLAIRHPSQPRARGASAATPVPPNPTSDYVDLLALIFESETIGDAVRAVVDIKLSDEKFTTFSILGMGDFVLEVEGSAQSAMLYELSTGWSMTLVGARDSSGLLGYSTDPTGPDGSASRPREKANLIQLVWNWVIDTLTSPLGILASMIVVIFIFTWLAYKIISHLQRHTLGSRR